MWSAVEFSHLCIRSHLGAGMVAVDATMGNGNDTLFLLEQVGVNGMVYAFDVQESALQTTGERLQQHPFRDRCRLFLLSHEWLAESLHAESVYGIDAIVFNLGYLPGSDKKVVTQARSTITALKCAVELLRPHGVASVVCYTGHTGAIDERDAVVDFVSGLDKTQYKTGRYTSPGRLESPECLLIQRAVQL